MKPHTPAGGRGWAYTGLILGGAVSVAANIAHSFIAPTGAPIGWKPEPGAVVSAIVWPVILFIAIEILARVAWPTGWFWRIIRFGGMTPVALVAALVSYRHLSGLLHHYGEETIVAVVGPIAIDGLMVMATSALLATARAHHTDPAPAAVPATVDPAVVEELTARLALLENPPKKVPARKPATPARATSTDTATGEATPAADTTTKAPPKPRKRTTPKVSTPATKPAVDPTPAPAPVTVVGELVDPVDTATSATVSSDLLPTARLYADSHHRTHGEPITPAQLGLRMRIPSTEAARLLAALSNTTNPYDTYNPAPAIAGPHNGSRPLQDVTA